MTRQLAYEKVHKAPRSRNVDIKTAIESWRTAFSSLCNPLLYDASDVINTASEQLE